jgi:hypothetical protein
MTAARKLPPGRDADAEPERGGKLLRHQDRIPVRNGENLIQRIEVENMGNLARAGLQSAQLKTVAQNGVAKNKLPTKSLGQASDSATSGAAQDDAGVE